MNVRKIIYLEPVIIDAVSSCGMRTGDVLKSAVFSFYIANDDIQKEYLNRAEDFMIKYNINAQKTFRESREGKVRVQMSLSQEINKFLDESYDKMTIVAALLYSNIIKEGER